jgi:hypothetical protein
VRKLEWLHGKKKRWNTYISVQTVDRVFTQRLDCSMCSVDRVELDPEYEMHLVIEGVDVDDIANRTEDLGDGLSVLGSIDTDKVIWPSHSLTLPVSLPWALAKSTIET